MLKHIYNIKLSLANGRSGRSRLNLIHSVGESLSASGKALKKSRAPRCVYGRKDFADSELQVMKPKECQWWDMYVNNYLMLEDSSMRAKFRSRFRIPYSIIWNSCSGYEMIHVLLVGVVQK